MENTISPAEKISLLSLFSAISGYLVSAYFLSRQYNHVLYILLALGLARVLVMADSHDLRGKILDSTKADVIKGLVFGLASIPFMWITVRLANMLRRG